MRTQDGNWESENSKVFQTPDEAANDNGPCEPPELTATVNCSKCGLSLEAKVGNDGSVGGVCPKCRTTLAGHAIPASMDT
jgi:hypothetical protein